MPLSFKSIYLTLLCLLLCFTAFCGTGTVSARSIAPPQWEQLTRDPAFNYRNDVEKERKPPAPRQPGLFSLFISKLFQLFSSGFGAVLAWGTIVLIVIYVIYKLTLNGGGFVFSRGKKKMTGPEEAPTEDFTATDWDARLQKAIRDNDLRLAVRYSYMWLLQMLHNKQLIKYTDDKTNYEYYRELEPTPYKQPFRQLSRQYEYANYGNYELSPTAYNNYIALFNNLRKQLGQ